jgi:hypothetical protein
MCLDDQILNTNLDQELPEPWKTQVKEHLNYCNACSMRYEQLRSLHRLVSQSRLDEKEMAPSKERVLTFIQNNYLAKKHKIGFLRKDFRIKTPMLLTAAAAFIIVLAGALLFAPKGIKEADSLIPSVVLPSEGQLVQVRATEGLAASQVLENFTLEEILKYLDTRGYEVEIRMRGIKPVGEDLDTIP